jgi:hypothetical protein
MLLVLSYDAYKFEREGLDESGEEEISKWSLGV